MKTVISIYLLMVCAQALPSTSKQNSFLFTQMGNDRNGNSFYSRFHINNEGRVMWDTVSRGNASCPSQSGTFEGTVTKEQLNEFIKLGSAEIYQQRKLKPKGEVGNSSASITTWENGKDLAEDLKTWTESFEKLNRKMALVQGELKPLEAINLSVKSEGNKIKLFIKNIGKISFRFILPKNPSDAFFYDNDASVKYLKNQKYGEFKIDPGKSSIVLLEKAQNVKTISYSNKMLRNLSSEGMMNDVFVCSKVN